jgi:hypothetical protein
VQSSIISRNALIDDVLDAWKPAIGGDFDGYRGHVYRMFNFARAFRAGPSDDDSIAVAAAFHDIGIWSDGTFDYLEPSARRARSYVEERKLAIDVPELTRMIELHHKLRSCARDAGELAESFRRADLVDVSLGTVTFGLPRSFVREARSTFPNSGFHRCLLRHGVSWAVRHPFSPLPMMRW